MKNLLIILFVFSFTTLFPRLKIKEIRTSSNDVLVVLLHNSDNSLFGREFDVNEVKVDNISEWKINNEQVSELFRYSTKTDIADHHIYLKTKLLLNNKSYKIETPYGDTTFTFNERETFCESIKTNQAAYSGLSKTKYALFSIWVGTGGAKEIKGELPNFQVFSEITNSVLKKGKLEELGYDISSGDIVYRIDLGDVPAGGPYKISVSGYGVSYPFGVGNEFSKKLAHVTFRGLYHQRCGLPLIEPYTWNIRMNPCHIIVYDTDASMGEAHVVVKGDEPQFPIYGGYHDAGDADRRGHHMAIPVVALTTYEAFPDLFTDRQFNIPDQFDEKYYITGSGNGIPDIIDEAVWGTLVWEYLQDESGGVHWQNETKGYPEPFEAPMDQDDKKYGTVRIDKRTTGLAAGLFLHLARIIKPYDENRCKELIIKAEKARLNVADSISNPHRLYYNIQKYLLTGDQESHKKVIELREVAAEYIEHSFDDPGDIGQEYVENAGYFFSYIVSESQPKDQTTLLRFREIIKQAAEKNIVELRKHAYPIGHETHLGRWGCNVSSGQYSFSNLLQWKLSGEQKYIDAACEIMDWTLGLNPIGISYVTGLGFHQVHNPHDRECSYTMKKGWGNKPGITVYGPGVLHGGCENYSHLTVPAMCQLKRGRQFADDRIKISMTEFTVHQTMAYHFSFTVLSQGGMWNGKEPFKK